jgi:methyl-accepting chemotaxis protein
MKQWLLNLKISRKLMYGFISVAILAAIVGGVGIIQLRVFANSENTLYEHNMKASIVIGDARNEFNGIRINVQNLIVYSSAVKAEYYKGIKAGFDNLEALMGSYMPVDSIDEANYQALQNAWAAYKQAIQDILKESTAGKSYSVILDKVVKSQTLGDEMNNAFKQVTEYNQQMAAERVAGDGGKATVLTFVMIGIIALAVAVALLLGALISRIIGYPLTKMAESAEKLAIGDVDATLKKEARKDEGGQLVESFEKVVVGRKGQVAQMEQLAAGNLTVEIRTDSDKDVLNKSLASVVASLNELIIKIKTAAEQVASGAELVSKSSYTLSQDATQQASSVQQLTASLEHVSTQTAENARNALNASESAKQIKSGAKSGNDQMRDMLKAMEGINESAGNIGKIIKVIDDIAFQTNILALNAAVEAARAGQHGKGFAVVAEEVRTLAAKSAQAAKETTDLIEGTVRRVEAGMKIADNTASALDSIVTEIARITDIIEAIALASNEQASAIEQINQGVVQVSNVVQNTAATSEESAAASEELTGQATQLMEIIGSFKVKESDKLGSFESHAAGGKSLNASSDTARLPSPKPTISLGSNDFGKY